jgi:hypothetical protein
MASIDALEETPEPQVEVQGRRRPVRIPALPAFARGKGSLAVMVIVAATGGSLIGVQAAERWYGHDPADFAYTCTHDYRGVLVKALDSGGSEISGLVVACDDMTAHPAGLSIVHRESWLTSDPARAARAVEWDRRHR